ATVLLNARLRSELPPSDNIAFIEQEIPAGAINRIWFEQRTVRELINRCGANILLSAGNFALLNSPVPQILLSRNSLYTSRDFYRDLHTRGDYRLWLDTLLKSAFAKWSIQNADRVVAPSKAFAAERQAWTGKPISAIHHGFDREAFVRDQSAPPGDMCRLLRSAPNALRLLFVSHYNYYRNFATLTQSLPLIKQQTKPRAFRLFLPCKLAAGANPGGYRTDLAASLIRNLRLSDEVIEL